MKMITIASTTPPAIEQETMIPSVLAWLVLELLPPEVSRREYTRGMPAMESPEINAVRSASYWMALSLPAAKTVLIIKFKLT
jgi:hypothetical protein